MIKKIIKKFKERKLKEQIKFIDIICSQFGRKLSYEQKLKLLNHALKLSKIK